MLFGLPNTPIYFQEFINDALWPLPDIFVLPCWTTFVAVVYGGD
jgi:hypothetical protein